MVYNASTRDGSSIQRDKGMRVIIDAGLPGSIERRTELRIGSAELACVHLSMVSPEIWNRSGHYMRRHRKVGDAVDAIIGPDSPNRSPGAPAKQPIPMHIKALRDAEKIPQSPLLSTNRGTFLTEPIMIAIPISDLVANLLRPCFHRQGLGPYRLFYFQDEPITERTYWCACSFGRDRKPALELKQVWFDDRRDRVVDLEGHDLLEAGLEWAAALVPLVVDSRPLSAVEIAHNDYDLRQIIGRCAQTIDYAYEGWFDQWDKRVTQLVTAHERSGKEFASFYHSVLAVDRDYNLLVRQVEGTLPVIAAELAAEGMIGAGLLDSGGSCALYDVWMGSYLNHSWYFREPRGAVLVFELHAEQRLPVESASTWVQRRLDSF